MAGEKILEIFCWEMKIDDLNIFMASSIKGAVRIGIRIGNNSNCLEFFKNLFTGRKLIKDKLMNRSLSDEIKSLLTGRQRSREISQDIEATPFQRMVWERIADIPFGQTRTYGEIALIVGRPRGARAVGQAMNRNPLPIIYP